jgi:SWI/SNF-related matrix-associated actin-dependent regulator 1 of chromatin subfamily A
MTFPLHPPALVEEIYRECRYDAKKATMLLTDEDYLKSRRNRIDAANVLPSSAPVAVGRVTELDEEREKARAAEREKAAKSAIYRRRVEMDSVPRLSTPTASSSVVSIPDTPDSPLVMRRTRPTMKRVVDSASEDESDSDVKILSSKAKPKGVLSFRDRALQSFNNLDKESLRELTGRLVDLMQTVMNNADSRSGCTPEHADAIVKLRPFTSAEDLEQKLGLRKKKTGIPGLSPRIFEDCVEVYKGYGAVDEILEKCENVGRQLSAEIAAWTGDAKAKDKGKGKSLDSNIAEDGALSLRAVPTSPSRSEPKGLLTKAPSLLAEGVQLKDYQLLGVSWLNLLKKKELSCILADEMGNALLYKPAV